MIFFFSSASFICSGVRPLVDTTNSLKNGPLKSQLQLAGQIMRLGQVLLRQFAQAFLAVDRHEDRRHQGDQRLIGADVGRRLLAADVLLARRQRQAERAIAARVLGLAHQPAGHLAHEFLLGGDDAGERAAVARRNGERLQLARHDIGIARRLQQSQRDRFGEYEDQQRAVSCARSPPRACTSSTMPKKLGDWMITAAVSSSILRLEIVQIDRCRFRAS